MFTGFILCIYLIESQNHIPVERFGYVLVRATQSRLIWELQLLYYYILPCTQFSPKLNRHKRGLNYVATRISNCVFAESAY